ncbi:hypothetical protein [Cellulophaga tyrosinoxydans]|uniref:NlpE N-terminal domain-containing protein n=1 Tax=Cellulophaga tyrosinoxydans TaxID=504486 RepID=A0A1W2ARA6_9FLAO|nr:hypothetical protein [Cellulophaga tyrosinoxydans]SMC63042.1 hypothetical protein SAMN05660703_2158 [Cellulophaga tyrosinoxydans]
MIKSIAISIFFLMTSFVSSIQDQTVVTIVYEGLDDGVYYFSSEEDFSTYAFKNIDEKASQKYNLADRKLIGSTFKVTYESEELLNEDNEPYEVLTLIDLTKIEKK